MSADTGRWTAYIFSLWLALYVGAGAASAHHDEGFAAAWLALCATVLMLPASADTRPKGGDGTKIAAPSVTSGAVGNAETPNPSPSPAAGR